MITLKVEKLSKHFGDRKVLKDLNFEVAAPGAIGITGLNGSGKTTLMKILAQMLTPTKGNVTLAIEKKAVPAEHFLDHIKMVGPEMALYEMLTGYENLRFFGKLAGVKMDRTEQDALLAKVGLTGRGDDMVGAYSSGMKQRLKYAVALLGRPKVLILDEPTANLDEEGKAIVGTIMAEHKREGILVVATNEAEDLTRVERVIRLG